jgi:hypothetical protein
MTVFTEPPAVLVELPAVLVELNFDYMTWNEKCIIGLSRWGPVEGGVE